MSAEVAIDPQTAPEPHPGTASLLAPGARFEGQVTFRGQARIDGRLEGEVRARGTLELGPEARVEARVEVDALVVAGALEGEVVARDRVELLSTARVVGSLETPVLVVADGATFDGPLRMPTATEPDS